MMIQRIQTIWLLLTSVFGFLSIKSPYYFNYDLQANSSQMVSANDNFLFLINLACIASFSLLCIFLFKNRKLQIKITVVSLILSLLNFYFVYISVKSIVQGGWSLQVVYLLFLPIFIFLAILGIRKDIKMLKNIDRIR